MNEAWSNVTIEKIANAKHGKSTVKNICVNGRRHHGFLINDEDTVRDFYFEDGKILRTKGLSLFYLPKGSSYTVDDISGGGCYFIDFEANIIDSPFCVNLPDLDKLLHSFNVSTKSWRKKDLFVSVLVKRTLYDVIYNVLKYQQKKYIPNSKIELINPAIDLLNSKFNDSDFKISDAVAVCDVSGVYFRRLFISYFGVSPKEYVIQKRMELAKELIESGNFSISEVALRCGYTEASHFSHEFTKRVGIPPNKYSITTI